MNGFAADQNLRLASKLLEQQGEINDLQERLKKAEALLRDLHDPSPCEHFDHHGQCQTHGWTDEGECAHARAQRLLARP